MHRLGTTDRRHPGFDYQRNGAPMTGGPEPFCFWASGGGRATLAVTTSTFIPLNYRTAKLGVERQPTTDALKHPTGAQIAQ